jgi:hypothetical protein
MKPTVHYGVGRFGEEEWRLTFRIGSHFSRMVGVVLADTKYPPDGKPLGRIGNDKRRGLQAGQR